jgi:hypothetical protein
LIPARLALLLILLITPLVHAQRDPGYGPLYVQGVLGVLDAGEAWTLDDNTSGESLESDLGQLILGGAMVQQMSKDGVFEYGFEGGGLVSWKNSNQQFFASNHVFAVSFDNNLFLVDLSFGGAISWRPFKPLRFYLSAGPTVAVGTVEIDDDSIEVEPHTQGAGEGSSIQLDASGREWAAGFGLYGRGGIEFIVRDYTFGASVRKSSTTLKFDNAGEIDLTAPQFFLTIGKRI